MGRKKRKVVVAEDDGVAAGGDMAATSAASTAASTAGPGVVLAVPPPPPPISSEKEGDIKEDGKPAASKYAMTSHSGEIIQEDIYISDGSESDDGEPDENGNGGRVAIQNSPVNSRPGPAICNRSKLESTN